MDYRVTVFDVEHNVTHHVLEGKRLIDAVTYARNRLLTNLVDVRLITIIPDDSITKAYVHVLGDGTANFSAVGFARLVEGL